MFQPTDVVINKRNQKQGTVCNPADYEKHPMKTRTLVLFEGKTTPQWVINELLVKPNSSERSTKEPGQQVETGD
jgi:hypothetical protein